MTDPDEIQLSKMAKTVLAMPHKRRDESKVGRTRQHPQVMGLDERARLRIEKVGPPSEQMVVFDAETLTDGRVVYHKPYLLGPDGRVALIAS
jgi:hypothetical protein